MNSSFGRRFQPRCYRLEERLAPALMTTFDMARGRLSITSDASDSISLTGDFDGEDAIFLNGVPAVDQNGLVIPASSVISITVTGVGFGGNLISAAGLPKITPKISKESHGRVAGPAIFLDGGEGDDTIIAGPHGSVMVGGSGSDLLIGGAGNDVLVLDPQDDDCNGGAGFDEVQMTLPATATSLSVSCDADGGVSSLSWSAGQVLTLLNTEIHSITVTGDLLTSVSGTVGGAGGADVAVATGRRRVSTHGIGSVGEDGVSLSFTGTGTGTDAARYGGYDLGPMKKVLAVALVGGPGNDTFSISPGAAAISVDGSAGIDTMVVNNYGFGSSVTTSSVTVPGMAPVSFNDVESAEARHQLFDGDALADLAAQGVTISAGAKLNADGSQSNTVTLTNSGSATVIGPTYDIKTSKKIADSSRLAAGSSSSRLFFPSASAGVTITTRDDPNYSPPLEAVLSGAPPATAEIRFVCPPAMPPGTSVSMGLKKFDWAPKLEGGKEGLATSCNLTLTIGNKDYSIELSEYFEKGDKPTQAQFAALLDSIGRTPTNGASSVVAMDAAGIIQVVASSGIDIDPTITAQSPGIHLFVGNQMIDRPPGSSSSGDGQANKADLSADGRYVVYHSTSTNIVGGMTDTNAASDIFLMDLASGVTTLVSQSGGVTGNGKSFDPKISPGGKVVTFLSLATNLIPGLVDTNGEADLFRFSVDTGVLECVSVVAGGGQTSSKGVQDCDIADDAIAWLTTAADVVPGSPTGLHLGTRKNGITEYRTITPFSGTLSIDDFRMAADADSVFVWTDRELPSSLTGVPDTNGLSDIVRIDLGTGVASLVSINTAGTATADGASPASGDRVDVSLSGAVCTFTSTAANLIPGVPSPASQGVYVRYVGGGGGPHIKRIDAFSSGQFGADNHTPSMSADGTAVAFVSTSDYTLPSPGSTAHAQVFVADTLNKSTQRVSQSASGAAGNGHSTIPLMSSNGEVVSFTSAATNILAGDVNGLADAVSSFGHHRWSIDLSTFAPSYSKFGLKYKPFEGAVELFDITTGTALASRPASSTTSITVVGRDGVDDQLTIDLDSGMTQVIGGVDFLGGTGQDTAELSGMLLTAMQKIRVKNKAGSARIRVTFDADTNAPSEFSLTSTGVDTVTSTFAPHEIEFAAVADGPGGGGGGSGGASVTVTNSGSTLQISNGSVMFRDTAYFDHVGALSTAEVHLSPYDDTCNILAATNPIPGVGVVIKGRAGNDTITASAVTSFGVSLDGEEGDDVCLGGSMDDFLAVSQGKDQLSGGTGNDVYVVSTTRSGKIRKIDTCGFDGTVAFSSFDVTINDPSGSNTLDFRSGPPADISLTSTGQQLVSPTGKLQYSGSPPDFIGSDFDDTVHVTASLVARIVGGDRQVSAGDVLIVDALGHAAGDIGDKIVFAGGYSPISHSGFESVSVINNAPTLQVASVIINDGSAQRSKVMSVTVAFSGEVDFGGLPPESASKLAKGSSTIPLAASVSKHNGFTSVVLSFPDQLTTDFGSLRDGRYTLTIFAANAFNAVMGPLDGNADGMPGGDFVLDSTGASGIYRQFGDITGDTFTDNVDFIQYRLANGSQFGQPNYVEAFDFDGNGFIDNVDFIAFRARIGASP